MITMNELVDLRMQQHIAHEIYRQQIMQRIPDPFPPMLPIRMPHHVIMPPRVTLPGVEVTLQNDELWKQFHQIGTEMIITKSGRRMFPSTRISLSGLEEEANYCVLLEMVPIGDCRYKFSGSQWVPAGGAEPQSPQRMYLHPDSPASGSHWQAQPILFNKVKLTNNTLDNSGHIVLASMHKYQPRIHVIRTSDLTQIPWAPQQAFVFTETEFVAVTAYQNDRITKLKIDHNPFAKGFRETGQSRCKRKMSSSLSDEDQDHAQAQAQPRTQRQRNDLSPDKSATTMTTDSATSTSSSKTALRDSDDRPQIKRLRSNGSACSLPSLDEVNATDVASANVAGNFSSSSETSSSSPNTAHQLRAATDANPPQHQPPDGGHAHVAAAAVELCAGVGATSAFMHNLQQNMQTLLRPSLVDLACSYFGRPQPIYAQHMYQAPHAALVAGGHEACDAAAAATLQLHEQMQLPAIELPYAADGTDSAAREIDIISDSSSQADFSAAQADEVDVIGSGGSSEIGSTSAAPTKRKGFSISAILGGTS